MFFITLNFAGAAKFVMCLNAAHCLDIVKPLARGPELSKIVAKLNA